MLADDHATARLGVRMALEEGGFNVVAEAVDARSAIEAALEHRPDLCLLDVYMPGGGIAAAAELSESLPGMPIVMLSVSETNDDLFEALRAGACGYLLKDTDPGRLPFALRAVLEGEAPLPRVLTARLITEFRRHGRERRIADADGDLVTLSERESEVLELLRTDMTTKQIAHRLGISPVTVRRHVSEALRKLRVSDRDAALRLTGETSQ
ncbi:MAG TPA: response regulator transcription factor [Solirubrobacteraceae bacterium]|nr:response regulator transcription factor [Solirubrobacteraceae bacterium]